MCPSLTPISFDSSVTEHSRSILLISQSHAPEWIRRALLTAAAREGWIIIVVNFNAAIFFGLVLLTAGFGEQESLRMLAVQIFVTSVAVVIQLVLLNDTGKLVASRPRTVMRLVIFNDGILMLGWGLSALLFLSPTVYERATTVLLLLTLTAVASSALTARLFTALLIGRTLIFLPAFVYFFAEQPPRWGFHAATVVLAYALAIGVGYAIHIQHLRQASLRLELQETLATLQAQSQTLSASLTDEQRSRAQLARETALRERFLRSVTHDLRQPINALGLFLLDLRRRMSGGQDTQVFEALQSCIMAANAIIDSVAQLAWIKDQLPRADITTIPLNPLLVRVAAETGALARQKSLTLFAIPTRIAVRADAAFLERAIRNLVHNAIQYTDHGRIVLGVRRRPGHLAEIQVLDTGRGIPPEEQRKIFEEFYQGRSSAGHAPGNIGLGLSIVTDLAEAMNGHMTCRSIEGKGSTFGLTLPRGELAAARIAPGTGRAVSLQGKLAVLIEDNESYSQIVAGMLRAAGLTVRLISEKHAIEAIQSETVRDHDIIIADYQLTPNLTALDLLLPLRPAMTGTCVIISEHSIPTAMQQIERNGWHFLRKPFTEAMLLNALSQAVA